MTQEISKYIKEQGIDLPCFFLEQTDSTNTQAKLLLKQGQTCPFVVVADSQTKGRGRYDRSFLSLAGKGVFLSYTLKVSDLALLNAYACFSALAVKNVLSKLYDIDAAVKWPNDVLVGGKKICGILPESVVCGSDRYAIIGIGINVNYDVDDFGDLKDKATSVSQLVDKQHSTQKTAGYLASELNRIYSDTAAMPTLTEQYRTACNLVGKTIELSDLGDTFSGVVAAINDDFSLTVLVGGKKKCVNWGEIVSIK